MPKKMKKRKQKVVLLFGAGASYGCLGLIRPPPLGKDLFESLCARYPKTWGSIDSIHRRDFINHFETGMDNYVKDENSKANSCLVDMAYFFSEFHVNYPNDNLYCKLFQTYKKELIFGDICVATTNYECLLEYALKENHILFKYWGNASGARLLKIHGSCNFTWPMEAIPTGTRENPGPSIIQIKIRDQELVAHNPRIIPELLRTTGLIPAMSYYAPGKHTNTGSEVIDAIRQGYAKAVSEADQLIIVGMRPNMSDNHIWSCIQTMRGKASIVCDQNDFLQYDGNTKIEFIGEKFDNAYGSICRRIDDVLKEK